MKSLSRSFLAICALTLVFASGCSDSSSGEVVRPEEIKSRRVVVYDKEAYVQLAQQWRKYYDVFPSEFAYANWMRAADYAGDPDFFELLDKGLKKYDANPVLLYLKGLTEQNEESRGRLERAAALDAGFIDPWFALIPRYMRARDEERVDVALRHILESGVIQDEVMDFNYNMISTLAPGAVLVTNGDNDTFPGWILTRILNFRNDVMIVNRSLLNDDWYPLYVIEQGLPRFVEPAQLDSLRSYVIGKMKVNGKIRSPGLLGDSLIQRIVEACKTAGRPVYLARTLYLTDKIEDLVSSGSNLGLATLATPPPGPYPRILEETFNRWIDGFRVAGLKSWRLRFSGAADAGRLLAANYATAILDNLEEIHHTSPGLVVPLFRWYNDNVAALIPQDLQGRAARGWCRMSDIKEIGEWCKKQGIGE